ncbi:hypothetical protein N9Q54_01585, partial [Octadecabacter sp.]|nr:hypothetical protein [Octadecabacter sp.]
RYPQRQGSMSRPDKKGPDDKFIGQKAFQPVHGVVTYPSLKRMTDARMVAQRSSLSGLSAIFSG